MAYDAEHDVFVKDVNPETKDKRTAGDGWIVDADVKMKDKRAFVKASQGVTESLDEADLYPHLTKFVKAWPYDGDPSNADAYDELTQTQFQEVVARVSEAFQVLAGTAK